MIEAPRIPLTSHHHIQADGVNVFYREAGPADAPAILLLHGFPTSSFQYRELIPRLADRYHVIAPDLPGFGFTAVPPERGYTYNFDALAKTIFAFTNALKLTRYALYVFDYGAPTGFRLAMMAPERVTAIVSQNGNSTYRPFRAGNSSGRNRRRYAQVSSGQRPLILARCRRGHSGSTTTSPCAALTP
jgi:pimeloyl-ACP methyl ester carboxylesterase